MGLEFQGRELIERPVRPSLSVFSVPSLTTLCSKLDDSSYQLKDLEANHEFKTFLVPRSEPDGPSLDYICNRIVHVGLPV